jgi:hypothetical protein
MMNGELGFFVMRNIVLQNAIYGINGYEIRDIEQLENDHG